jgi:hypothetical protein
MIIDNEANIVARIVLYLSSFFLILLNTQSISLNMPEKLAMKTLKLKFSLVKRYFNMLGIPFFGEIHAKMTLRAVLAKKAYAPHHRKP